MYNGCHDITYLNGGHYPSDDLELVTQREENILSIWSPYTNYVNSLKHISLAKG